MNIKTLCGVFSLFLSVIPLSAKAEGENYVGTINNISILYSTVPGNTYKFGSIGMQAVIGAAHPDGNMDIISKNFTAITFDQKNHLKTVISTDLKPNFVLFACGKEKKNLSKDFLIGTENDKYALYPTNDETNAEIMNLMTTCSMVLISIGPENKFYVILLDGMKRALDSLTTIKGIPFDVGNKDPEFPLATEDGKPFVYPDGGAH